MVKPRARQTGEGIYYANNRAAVIYHKQRVDGMIIHLLAGFDDLGRAGDRLRSCGHDR